MVIPAPKLSEFYSTALQYCKAVALIPSFGRRQLTYHLGEAARFGAESHEQLTSTKPLFDWEAQAKHGVDQYIVHTDQWRLAREAFVESTRFLHQARFSYPDHSQAAPFEFNSAIHFNERLRVLFLDVARECHWTPICLPILHLFSVA